MKNIFYFILLMLLTDAIAQNDTKIGKGVTFKNSNQPDTTQVNINSTFLLLGTLNDYISYDYGNVKNKFDRYYPNEKPLMQFVDSIAKKDFNIVLIEEKNCFISEKMSLLMHSFYNKNNLKDNLFDSNAKKLSFLLGVYFRNGEKIKDNIYKIQLANSPKHKQVYEFLNDLNCKNIYFRRLNNIPTIYQIYFESTEIIEKYFATIEKQKEALFDSKIESFRSVKVTEALYMEEIQKENLKIIQLFTEK